MIDNIAISPPQIHSYGDRAQASKLSRGGKNAAEKPTIKGSVHRCPQQFNYTGKKCEKTDCFLLGYLVLYR